MAATDKEKKYPDWWYQSANQKELDSLAGQIASRPDFKFKVDHEALYDYYKGEYDRQGRETKLDTEAKGAALTGGYGNSYARQAGQQAYEEQVEGLQEDVAPDLWQMALDKYTREGKALVDRYSALQKQEKEDYEAWEEEHADEIETLQRQQEQQKAAASAVDRIAGKNNRYDPMAQYTGQRVDQITTEKTTKDPGQVTKDLSWEGYRATMDAAIGKVTGKQDFYDRIPETPQYVDSPLYIQKLPTAEELRDGLVPYEALAKVPDFLARSNYEPKDVGSRLTRQEMEGMSDEQQDKYFAAFNSDSSQEDLLYEAVNGNYLALLALNSNGYEIFDGLDEKYRMTPSELMHMSAEEISIFNYVYKTLGLDAAKGYLNYLADYLSARQRQAVQTAAANRAEKQPFLSSVDTIITSPFRGQIASVGVLSDLADDGKLRTNADYNMLDYQANAVRGKVSEMIEKKTPFGKVGSFVYGAGMSIGDSLARMVTSAGNPFLSAQLAACSAGVSTISLAKDLGLNDGQALALGVIAGFAEGFFEKHNLEDLLNADLMKDGKLKYILKNALNETTEEVSTELVNTVADIILAWDKGQMRTAIDAYKAQGMDAGQASLHAFCDKLLEIGEAGLVGALTGSIMSGSNVALNSIVSMAYKKSGPTQAARQPYSSTDAPAVNMPGTELSEGLQDVETKADSPAAAWDQAVRQYVQGEQAASTATIQEVQTVESNTAKAENSSLKEASKKYGAQAAMMENAYQEGQDVERFDREYKLAYDLGKEGASRELLDDGETLIYLTAEQRDTAYRSGAAAVSGYQEGRNAQGQRKRGTVKGYGVDVKAMAQAFNVNQAYAYKAIAQIADVTGVDVILFESKPDANGELRGGVIDGIDMSNAQGAFSWHNNKIYIDINAGVLRGADMGDVAKYSMLRTFTHEFTHFIEKHNAEQYDAFRELVFDTMRRNGTDPDALILAYMDRHEGTTRDAASREVVAEAMTDILPQSRFVEELAQKHEGIFKTLRNKLKNFVKRIKAYFKNIGSSQSAEVAAVAQYMDGALRYAQEIVEAFDRVAVQAVENYQAEQTAQKNTAPEGGVQMQIRESFYKEFDAWDKKNANITFVTGTTSEALKSIGMKDQEIILRSGTVLQKLKDHPEMTYDIFRNIPDLLEHPIIVQFSDAIDTKTQRPKYESSITVLGELYADVKEDGKTVKKPVLVSLELLPTNQKKTAVLDFAIIKSAYSKNALQQYINENSILYIDPDKKRTNSWLSLNRLQLPLGENRYGSVRKITYADGKVKVQNAKNMTAMQRALQAAGIVDAYGNQQSTKEKAEQNQERKGTITDWDVLEQASSIVGGQSLTVEQQTALDSFNNHLEKVKKLSAQKAEQYSILDNVTENEEQAVRNRIATLNRQINAETKAMLELENTSVLKRVLSKARIVIEEDQAAKRREAVEKYRERRNKTEMRSKIQKAVNKLNDLLLKPTKERHVPIGLQKAVAEILDEINMETSSAEDRKAQYEATLRKYDRQIALENDPEKIRKLREKRRAYEEKGDQFKAKMDALKKAYDDLKDSDDPLMSGAYSDGLSAHLLTLLTHVGDTPLREMSLFQLQCVYDVCNAVLTTVSNANTNFNQALKRSTADTAKTVMAEIKTNSGENVKTSTVRDVGRDFSWKNTKPIYAIERIKSPTFRILAKALFDGSYQWGADMNEAANFRQSISDKHGFKMWDMEQRYEFTSNTGKGFTLSLDQIMTIYAYSKRDAAHDHMTKGGIQLPKGTVEIAEKNGRKKSFILDDRSAYGLSDEIIGEIIGKLTAEQKAFADEMQMYLSDVMGAKGNEVSLRLHGIKLFGEKHYFPLRVSSAYLEKAKASEDMKKQGQISIVNAGFTHSVKPNANKPIIVDGFMGMWAEHVAEMSAYHSMALPVEDFRRVYNYNDGHAEDTDSRGVRPVISNAYGSAAMEYFDQLYKDLNGGVVSDPRETRSKKRISNFKKAATMLSMSVAFQQPSSIGRALALIDAKFFVGKRIGDVEKGKLVAEMQKYAPIVHLKQMGGFDTNVGSGAKDYLLAEQYSAKEWKTALKDKRFRDEAMGWLPAKMDEVTWCMIWNTVKRETCSKNPALDTSSEEFLRKAGERFTEVIEKTQVYDSVLSRSSYMRSRSGLMQMATSFMAEPTTTINMIEDALRTKDKRKIARTIGAVATSIVLNNLLASIVYAARDDDEDETFLEKYIEAFISGMVEDFNPLSYYPYLRDINSLLQGYDVERADMSALSDLADATKKVVILLAKDTEYMTDEELAERQKAIGSALLSVFNAGCSAFGIPAKNVIRDATGLYNAVMTACKDFSEDGKDTTLRSILDVSKGAALDAIPVIGLLQNDTRADKVYRAVIAGDTVYENRLLAGKDESQRYVTRYTGLAYNDPRIKTAAIAHRNGKFSEYRSIINEIVAEGHFNEKEAVGAINLIIGKLKRQDENQDATSGVGKKPVYDAADYYKAVMLENEAEIKEVYDYLYAQKIEEGYIKDEADDAIKTAFRTQCQDAYMAGEIGRDRAVVFVAEYGGKGETEVKKWDFELEYGFSWGCRVRAYRLGKISEDDLIDAVMDIEGEDQKGAEEYIRFLDLEMAQQDFDINANDAGAYFSYAEPVGIDIGLYLEYKTQKSAYTKKADILEVIDALPISSKQKDALYFAEDWAESTLDEAPWH